MSDLNHLIISKVIPSEYTNSISTGDVVTRINGKPASDFYANTHKAHSRYQYDILRKSGEQLQIDSPVPIAVELTPSPAFLLKEIKSGNHDWAYFESLWENDDWDNLRRALDMVKSHPAIDWLFKKLLRQQNYTPENLFLGAVAFHDGDKLAAKAFIEDFMEHAMDGYTTNFYAIAYFYLAQLEDDAEHADYLLSEANDYNNARSGKINRHLESKDFELVSSNEWLGAVFPTDLTLENVYRPNVTSLKNIIAAGKHAVTPICVMPSYRANGPYHDAMLTYQKMWPYFKDYINPMIVLADADEDNFAEHWLGGERKVMADNIPLTVMMDTSNFASAELGLTGSPTLFVIDANGNIIQEGLSEPMEYWKLQSRR